MSWTQGIQPREEISKNLLYILEKGIPAGIQLECIVWDISEPERFYVDYYEVDTMKFSFSKAFELRNI